MTTNRIVLSALIALVAIAALVSPVYADDGTIKPVCNASHTFLDKLFGACVDVAPKQDTSVQLPSAEQVIQMGIDNTTQANAELNHTMTEDNKVNDAAWSLWDMFE